MFGEKKISQKFLIFQETELSYISGNGNTEKFSHKQLRNRKVKEIHS